MGLFHTALVILAGTLLLIGGFVLTKTDLIKDTRVKRGIKWMLLFILGILIGFNLGTILFYLALAFALLATLIASVIAALGVTLIVWIPAFLLISIASKYLPEEHRDWYMGTKVYILLAAAFLLTTNLIGIPFTSPVGDFVARMTAPLPLYMYNFFNLNIDWINNLL